MMSLSFTAPRMGISELENEFSNLPEEVREQALRDIHGTSDAHEETPELLEEKLFELVKKLEQIPSEEKGEFLRAEEECPDYSRSAEVRLCFLRADLLDAQKAARRLVTYWKDKYLLFGEGRTFHRSTLADLTEQDIVNGRNQSFYLLPKLDKAGRGIIFYQKPRWEYQNREQMLRWMSYVGHTAVIESESIQRHGIVLIAFSDGPMSTQKFDRKLDRRVLDLLHNSWPARFAALHHCFDSRVFEVIMPFVLFMLGPKMRAHYRMYPGTTKHTRLEDFEKCGITVDMLPRVMGGNLDFDVNEWIDNRRRLGL